MGGIRKCQLRCTERQWSSAGAQPTVPMIAYSSSKVECYVLQRETYELWGQPGTVINTESAIVLGWQLEEWKRHTACIMILHGNLYAFVTFASPVLHPSRVSHSSKSSDPAARCMTPSTPPPPSSVEFAAYCHVNRFLCCG